MSQRTTSISKKSIVEALQRREGTFDGDRISAVGAQIDTIGTVPSTISQRARKVFLSNNNLRHLQQISQFIHCEILSLTHNDINYLEDLYPLKELVSLKKLSLEGNLVTKLPFFRDFVLGHCPHLQQLDKDIITDEDRLRATVNFRRACLFISRAITNAVRNVLLNSMVVKRLAHREMRTSIFNRYKSLQASFIAPITSIHTVSLSQLVAMLKHCGVFRQVLLQCEAHMSRELQHSLLKIQLSHLKTRVSTRAAPVPLSDDDVFARYFAEQEVVYEHFLRENEGIELFVGSVSKAHKSFPQLEHADVRYSTDSENIDSDRYRNPLENSANIELNSKREVQSQSGPVLAEGFGLIVSGIAKDSSEHRPAQSAPQELFNIHHNRKQTHRLHLQEEYRRILSSAVTKNVNDDTKPESSMKGKSSIIASANYRHSSTNAPQMNEDMVESSLQSLNNHISIKCNYKENDLVHTKRDSFSPQYETHQRRDTLRSESPTATIRRIVPQPTQHATSFNSNSFIAMHGNVNSNINNQQGAKQSNQDDPSDKDERVQSNVHVNEGRQKDNEAVSEAHDDEVMPLLCQLRNLAMENDDANANGKGSAEDEVLQNALDQVETLYERRLSELTTMLQILQHQIDQEQGESARFLDDSSTLKLIDQTSAGPGSMSEVKRQIQLLSKKLILLQRTEQEHCAQHRRLRHTVVSQLSPSASSDANKTNVSTNKDSWVQIVRESALLSQWRMGKRLSVRANMTIAAADSDLTLYHALQKKFVFTQDQQLADHHILAQVINTLEGEMVAVQSLQKDITRVEQTLQTVSTAVEAQKIAQRVLTASRHPCRIRRVSLLRHMFRRWSENIGWLQELKRFVQYRMSRDRKKLLRRTMQAWHRVSNAERLGRNLQRHRERVLLTRYLFAVRVKVFRNNLFRKKLQKWNKEVLRKRFHQWWSLWQHRIKVDRPKAVLHETYITVFSLLRVVRAWRHVARHLADTRHVECTEIILRRRLRMHFAEWWVRHRCHATKCAQIATQIIVRQNTLRLQRGWIWWSNLFRHRSTLARLIILRRQFTRLFRSLRRSKRMRQIQLLRFSALSFSDNRNEQQMCRVLLRRWKLKTKSRRGSRQLWRFATWHRNVVTRRTCVSWWRRWLRYRRHLCQLRGRTQELLTIKRQCFALRHWLRATQISAKSSVSRHTHDTCKGNLILNSFQSLPERQTALMKLMQHSDEDGVAENVHAHAISNLHQSHSAHFFEARTTEIPTQLETHLLRDILKTWNHIAREQKRLRLSAAVVMKRREKSKRLCYRMWGHWCRAISQRLIQRLRHLNQQHANFLTAQLIHNVSDASSSSFLNSNDENFQPQLQFQLSNIEASNHSKKLAAHDQNNINDSNTSAKGGCIDSRKTNTNGSNASSATADKRDFVQVDRDTQNWRDRHTSLSASVETLEMSLAAQQDALHGIEIQRDSVLASVNNWEAIRIATLQQLAEESQSVADIETRLAAPVVMEPSRDTQLLESQLLLLRNEVESLRDTVTLQQYRITQQSETDPLQDTLLTSLVARKETVSQHCDTLRLKVTMLRAQNEEVWQDRHTLVHRWEEAQNSLAAITAEVATQMVEQETTVEQLQQEAQQFQSLVNFCREEETHLRSLLHQFYNSTSENVSTTGSLRDIIREHSIVDDIVDDSQKDQIADAQLRGMAMALYATHPHKSSAIPFINPTGLVSAIGTVDNTASPESSQNPTELSSILHSTNPNIPTLRVSLTADASDANGDINSPHSLSGSKIAFDGTTIDLKHDSEGSGNASVDTDVHNEHWAADAVDRDIARISQRLRDRLQPF